MALEWVTNIFGLDRTSEKVVKRAITENPITNQINKIIVIERLIFMIHRKMKFLV